MSQKKPVHSGSNSTNGGSVQKSKTYSFQQMLSLLTDTCEELRKRPIDVANANAQCNCIGKMMSVVNTARRIGNGNPEASCLPIPHEK